MDKNLGRIEDSIRHYLITMATHSDDGLKHYSSHENWRFDANKELEQRRATFMNILSMPELSAIANGEIDIARLAAEVDKEYGFKG